MKGKRKKNLLTWMEKGRENHRREAGQNERMGGGGGEREIEI